MHITTWTAYPLLCLIGLGILVLVALYVIKQQGDDRGDCCLLMVMLLIICVAILGIALL